MVRVSAARAYGAVAALLSEASSGNERNPCRSSTTAEAVQERGGTASGLHRRSESGAVSCSGSAARWPARSGVQDHRDSASVGGPVPRLSDGEDRDGTLSDRADTLP